MQYPIRNKKTCMQRMLLMLAAGLACAGPAMAAADRVAELEQRVSELESMVEALLDERGRDTDRRPDDGALQAGAAARQAAADAASARQDASRARERIAELDRQVQPLIAAATDKRDMPEFFYGGYIKTDFILSDFDDGSVAGDSIGRDFLVPSTIPVGGDGGEVELDSHARQTRFHLGTRHQIGEAKLGSYIEMDFLATPGGNERVSNSFSPRLRHAYVTYDNWLVGQTWNTFMDVATLPESVDFIGPSGSTSFGREPMVRYTRGGFAVALENPETTVTPIGGGRIETDDNSLPELAARYTWKRDWGHLQFGGLLRQLELDNAELGVDATEPGWGLSFSGKAMLGRDDVRFMVVGGEGLGRHVGLNFANGAAITDSGDLESIATLGAFVAYRHWWNQRWRSTAAVSWMTVDNPVRFTGTGVSESNWGAQINLLYSPAPPFTFGVEYLTAEREIESGATGQLDRFQFTTRYAF